MYPVITYLGKVLEFSPGENAGERDMLKGGPAGVLGGMIRIEEEGVLR